MSPMKMCSPLQISSRCSIARAMSRIHSRGELAPGRRDADRAARWAPARALRPAWRRRECRRRSRAPAARCAQPASRSITPTTWSGRVADAGVGGLGGLRAEVPVGEDQVARVARHASVGADDGAEGGAANAAESTPARRSARRSTTEITSTNPRGTSTPAFGRGERAAGAGARASCAGSPAPRRCA